MAGRYETEPIDPNEPLKPGDRVELHFKTIGGTVLQAAQIALAEKKLEGRKDWRIINYNLPDAHHVIFRCEVLPPDESVQVYKADIGVTCLMIAAAIMIAVAAYLVVLDQTRKIVATPAGRIAVAGAAATGIGVLALALLILFGDR